MARSEARTTAQGALWARWAVACAVGYGLLRLYWAAGGRLGYTACDRTEVSSAAEIASGQVVPRWVPVLRGRQVPRLLAVIPAGVASVALVSYGLLGVALIARALLTGTTWAELGQVWAYAATEAVFLLWGVALAAATFGYHLATRSPCGTCEPLSAWPTRVPPRSGSRRARPGSAGGS
ncbi:hypothetical protein HUO13_04840 [Saccharopolyspora erythraea]|uniref:hypothetical protein n=1 Tax=Saccharopolyspora erythraea TaxID=1836 RepID=UPI001BA9B31F|nr:hypothetical protein [Saccharopolyspora erythraea]QUH00225.1 hypothetical protein HUO13_04840 [Saccharopolyspora erythraea]